MLYQTLNGFELIVKSKRESTPKKGLAKLLNKQYILDYEPKKLFDLFLGIVDQSDAKTTSARLFTTSIFLGVIEILKSVFELYYV